MRHYLVTGGAGFLGLHLAQRLHQAGNKVTSVDIAPHPPEEYAGIQCHSADIRDPSFERTLDGVDTVIHAAAALPSRGKKEMVAVNQWGTRNVLESCLRRGIKRVVFISSTGVYGLPKENPVEETDPLVGIGSYGETKIEAEKICREYRQKGVCIPVIRAKTIIGSKRLGAFQILFDWIQCGKKIPVIGNGKNRYQLLHVDDLVDAILLAAEGEEGKVNTEFNVGAKIFGTVEEDITALIQFARSSSRILKTPAHLVQGILCFFEWLRLSPFYRWFYMSAAMDSFVSIEKMEQLGFAPKKSNQEALIETYRWYLTHLEEGQKTGVRSNTAWKQGILRFIKGFF